jgi:hypothetical protein
MWKFDYSGDPFKENTKIDLRCLNEKIAGESGFIGLSKDKESFVLGNGNPVRFWACNTFAYRKDDETLKTHARFLAKMGVNMVRMHGSATPKKKGDPFTSGDEKNTDDAWRMTAAMKEQGIYSTISPYWCHNGHCGGLDPHKDWGIEDGGESGMWGLLFFNEKVQEAYKSWTYDLYTKTNPYTGIALCDEPAVGIIQIQNEDSLLFWTVSSIKGAQRRLLEEKFTEWLEKKYGSLRSAVKNWDGETIDDDDFENNRAGIMHIYNVFTYKEKASRRAVDTARFLGGTMYDFHAMIEKHYRDIGCKQLINANNWYPADYPKLNDLERWSYTPNAVIGLNRYFTGLHNGPRNGWLVDVGDHIKDTSVTVNPRALPINIKQITGYPHIVPESTWVAPLRYQAEGPLLVAAYQSLTGVNAFYWFCTGSAAYSKREDIMGWQTEKPEDERGFHKWHFDVPSIMGMFPAAALLFRNGYIKQGETVLLEERTADDIFEMKVPAISEDAGHDPNRDGRLGAKQSDYYADPLIYLTGPVKVRYGADKTNTNITIKNLEKYIDRASSTVKSVTDELAIDYGRGVFTMNAPCAKGAAGFLDKAGCIDLNGVTITCENEYLSIALVSTDSRPLDVSRNILLQAGTVMIPEGFETIPDTYTDKDSGKTFDCERIVKTGVLPFTAEDLKVKVRLDNKFITKWHLLDSNGEVRQTFDALRGESGAIELTLPQDTMYIILEA